MSLSRHRPLVAALATTLATALALPGCNIVFHSAPAEADAVTAAADASPDAMPGTKRIDLKFSNAQDTQRQGEDPSVSNDALDLWYTVITTPTDRDIHHAQRPSTDALFSTGSQLNINTGMNDLDGALTDDQLFVTFATNIVDPQNGYTINQAKRNNPAENFEPAKPTSVVIPFFYGYDASPDGLQIFFIDNSDIKSKTRPSRDALLFADGPTARVLDPEVTHPTVSFDRLELVYPSSDRTHLLRALLSPDGTQYGPPQPFDVGGNCNSISDPDFSPNAMLLAFTCDGKIYFARRPAP
jgi:hypothetical protein